MRAIKNILKIVIRIINKGIDLYDNTRTGSDMYLALKKCAALNTYML